MENLNEKYKLEAVFPFVDIYSMDNKFIIISNNSTINQTIYDITSFMNIHNYKEINGYICTQDKRTINDVKKIMNEVKTVKITNDNGKITLHYNNDDEYYSNSNNIEDYYSIINKYIIE